MRQHFDTCLRQTYLSEAELLISEADLFDIQIDTMFYMGF
jgi:hypothetical protein